MNGSARFSPTLPLISFFFLIGSFSLLSSAILAQEPLFPDSIPLREAVIVGQPMSAVGFARWRADSLPLSCPHSLAQRLALESAVAVRPLAPGMLTTLSIRGAGPARTPIFWNGINLQSAMNGVVDAALLPLWPGDALEVIWGGDASALGAGAMGGSVLVRSAIAPAGKGWGGMAGGSAGSFGALSAHGGVLYGGSSLQLNFRGGHSKADNDFPYQNIGLDGKPYQARQSQNAQEKTDWQQSAVWQPNARNIAKCFVWQQSAFRKVPPSKSAPPAETWQRDRALRVVAAWDYTPGKHSIWSTRLALNDEYIAFRQFGKTDESHSRTWIGGAAWQKLVGRAWRISSDWNAQYQTARSDGYAPDGTLFRQRRTAGHSAVEFAPRKNLKWLASMRKEWVEGMADPFTWSLGAMASTLRTWSFSGHVSRTFNLPTFNDRFWAGLGNPALQPEKGYSVQASAQYKRSAWDGQIAGYWLVLDDWILWQPGADGLFRPGNLRQVQGRGMEVTLGMAQQWGRWRIRWRGMGQWSDTRHTAVYGGNSDVLGKQLPYTPRWSASCNLQAVYKRWTGAYLHQVTGARYSTADEAGRLPAFHTGTLMLQWLWRNTRQQLSFECQAENIWNHRYEFLSNRPMPGRNWRLGATLHW